MESEMTKWTAGAMALAAILAASAASAEQLAARTGGSILPVSRVLKEVEAHPDFGAFQAIHYDRRARAFSVLYATKAGEPGFMVVDARTGKVRR